MMQIELIARRTGVAAAALPLMGGARAADAPLDLKWAQLMPPAEQIPRP